FGSANQHSTGSQKCRDEQSARPGVKVLCRAYLEDAAALDYCDAVGQLKGFLLIVSHQDRGDSELLLDVPKAAPELGSDLDIQGAERLVEQQHAGLVCQRPCECDALLLAT